MGNYVRAVRRGNIGHVPITAKYIHLFTQTVPAIVSDAHRIRCAIEMLLLQLLTNALCGALRNQIHAPSSYTARCVKTIRAAPVRIDERTRCYTTPHVSGQATQTALIGDIVSVVPFSHYKYNNSDTKRCGTTCQHASSFTTPRSCSIWLRNLHVERQPPKPPTPVQPIHAAG